jgi:hypothetical protein
MDLLLFKRKIVDEIIENRGDHGIAEATARRHALLQACFKAAQNELSTRFAPLP